MVAKKSLDALRREIDRIDTEIHELIRRRTRVVESVRDLKKGQAIKIRPAREDEILYRLVADHTGNFPKRELTRIWRELIVATLSFEGPFSVAVYANEDDDGCRDLARDFYGSYTPMTAYPSARRVIETVQSNGATVGVLPLPRPDDKEPWWPHLVGQSEDAPRIIARLPFSGPGNGRDANAEAVVICPVDREETGRDRSWLVIEADDQPGLTPLVAAMKETGLSTRFSASWRDQQAGGPWYYLIEVDGFVGAQDRAVSRFIDAFGSPVNRVVCLGSYGIPLSAEELAPAPEEKPAARRGRKSTAKSTPASRKRRS
ncbi:MAG: chorismate mutase [Rhodospirillales bacterium]|nr:chorismate mutase [Rhodospirillales bacterium]